MAGRFSCVFPTALAFLLLPYLAIAFPICLNSEAPLPLKKSLEFCSSFLQNESSCCNSTTDQQLKIVFQSFNVSDVQCAASLKQILCAQCDPYAGDLFEVELQQKWSVPILCNSTSASNGTSASNTSTNAYCEHVWTVCKDVPVQYSPFAPSLQGTGGASAAKAAAKLTDLWQSEADFCTFLGGSVGTGEFCFSGEKFSPFSISPEVNLEGICFEKIGEDAYLNMFPHPDGSNRIFLASQAGKIWLAMLPVEGSGQNLSIEGSSPYLDISGRVVSSGEYGLLGLAFHPNFKNNGRFFVSYNCDKTVFPDCAGRCSCSADTGCTLSELGSGAGSIPCQISSVIAEYSANGSSSPPLQALSANPDEVRRIFTMGLPYSTHHAGQILFGPTDNYLYFMMGDGGSTGDPFNFAQNKKSLLGKMMRFDIDTIPSAQDVSNLALWGNYSIPVDNPFVEDNLSRPEIWAYGLRNPWRCSFDTMNPSYFFCGDVGQETYEEVDLITKGGNYGWRVYEGTALYTPPRSPGGNTSVNSIQPIFPILEYSHKSVNPVEGTASITGGFVSRGAQDACLYGRYVYADLYGGAMWAAAETPPGSGNFTTAEVNFTCSASSPMNCQKSATNRQPNFLYIFSFGQDNSNNLYVLSATGVFKVVNPKNCNFFCNATLPFSISSPILPPSAAPAPAPTNATSTISKNSASGTLPTCSLLIVVISYLVLSILL